MEKKEILTLIRNYTLPVNFSDKESNILKNLLSIHQVSSFEINGKIEVDQILLYGKKFGELTLPIKYSSLQKVKIEAYCRLVPVASVGVHFPTNVYYICLKLLTKKGFLVVLETRDYENLTVLFKNFRDYNVHIEDSCGLEQLISNKNAEEIDTFLLENWEKISEKNGLLNMRADYLNK